MHVDTLVAEIPGNLAGEAPQMYRKMQEKSQVTPEVFEACPGVLGSRLVELVGEYEHV